MNQPTDMSSKLEQATRSAHDSLERVPYSIGLQMGDVPTDSVVGHLRALAIIYGALDGALAKASTGDRLQFLGRCSAPRLPALMRDLSHFPPSKYRDIQPAIRAAIDLAGCIQRRSATDPASLAGYVYVLEGSRLGALSIAKDIDRILGLGPGESLEYFRGLSGETAEHWKSTIEQLDAHLFDADVQRAVIDAACETFDGFIAIFGALYPYKQEEMLFTSTAINPESGDHPVPQDSDTIRVSLEAGNRCLEQYPYVEMRYGERGVRFTQSDSAWLATLGELDEQTAVRHVKWLARVLSSRGMPSRLLQVHIELLYEDLMKLGVRGGESAYENLRLGASELGESRSSYVDDRQLEQLNAEFEGWVGPDWAKRMRNTGQLIVSSAVDLKSGMVKSTDSFRLWICDPSRFPRTWIEGVERLYAESL